MVEHYVRRSSSFEIPEQSVRIDSAQADWIVSNQDKLLQRP